MGMEICMANCMWIIPVVMMTLFFLFFRFGVVGKRRFNRFSDEMRDRNDQESALDVLKKQNAKREITREKHEKKYINF
jgi:uncharacterized membrane protein